MAWSAILAERLVARPSKAGGQLQVGGVKAKGKRVDRWSGGLRGTRYEMICIRGVIYSQRDSATAVLGSVRRLANATYFPMVLLNGKATGDIVF